MTNPLEGKLCYCVTRHGDRVVMQFILSADDACLLTSQLMGLEPPHFAQGLAVDSEDLRCSGLVAGNACQHVADIFGFHLSQGSLETCFPQSRKAHQRWQVWNPYDISVCHYHQALYDIFQFSHVARPVVILQNLQRPVGESGSRPSHFLGKLIREMMRQNQDIITSFT